MKKYLLLAAQGAGLALTIVPALLVFQGSLSNDAHKQLMLIGVFLWFGAVILKERQ
jgi:high-affinity Fe2+/Pb2+ permease